MFNKQRQRKIQLAQDGFYGKWSPGWHEDFLSQRAPANFSRLKTEPDAVHGHYAEGVFLISRAGVGFAKNDFHNDTGRMSFAATLALPAEIAHKLGGTTEEREAILMGFATDLLDVSDKLVAPGMPVFAQAA